MEIYWKSPLIDEVEYGINAENLGYMDILKNMPQTRKKMQEIESILPAQSSITDINKILKGEPFNEFFQTEEFPVALYITFK